MQLVSTFAYVYFKDVSALLESICYLGPHALYINLKEKASKTKKEEKKNTIKTNTDTVCKRSIQQIKKIVLDLLTE